MTSCCLQARHGATVNTSEVECQDLAYFLVCFIYSGQHLDKCSKGKFRAAGVPYRSMSLIWGLFRLGYRDRCQIVVGNVLGGMIASQVAYITGSTACKSQWVCRPGN